jgi:hypothetical protein
LNQDEVEEVIVFEDHNKRGSTNDIEMVNRNSLDSHGSYNGGKSQSKLKSMMDRQKALKTQKEKFRNSIGNMNDTNEDLDDEPVEGSNRGASPQRRGKSLA